MRWRVLSLVVLVTVWSSCSSGARQATPSSHGPLIMPLGNGVSVPIPGKGPATLGTVMIANPGVDAVITGAALVGAVGARVVGVRAQLLLDLENTPTATATIDFPPDGLHAQPLPVRVPDSPRSPEDGRYLETIELLIGIGFDQRGTFEAVLVDYRIGSHRYRVRAESRGEFCRRRADRVGCAP